MYGGKKSFKIWTKTGDKTQKLSTITKQLRVYKEYSKSNIEKELLTTNQSFYMDKNSNRSVNL